MLSQGKRMLQVIGWAFRPLDRLGPHYLFLTLSGISAVAWPPVSVQANVLAVSMYFWIGSLIIGGLLCMVGRSCGLQLVKMIGLSLILVSVLTFILGQISRWPVSAAGICMLLALFSFLGYRMRDARVRHDAESAIRSGSNDRPALVAYANESLARRERDRDRSHRRSTPLESVPDPSVEPDES